jgi:hypothetical protein
MVPDNEIRFFIHNYEQGKKILGHMKSSYMFSKFFKTIDHSDLKLPRMK